MLIEYAEVETAKYVWKKKVNEVSLFNLPTKKSTNLPTCTYLTVGRTVCLSVYL